jgi:cell cycle sensor histidine kinase DivJ
LAEHRTDPADTAQATPRAGAPGLLLLATAALAGAVGCLIAGGPAGPLGVLCLAPLAVALVTAAGRNAAAGAALSVLAAAVSAVGQLLGLSLPAPQPEVGVGIGLLGLTVIGGTLGAGLVLNRRRMLERQGRHDTETTRLARLLSGQPHLVLALYPHGKPRAIHGHVPEGIDADLMRRLGLSAVAAEPAVVTEALRQAQATGRAETAFAPAAAQDRWVALSLRRSDDNLLLGVMRDATTDRAREAALEQARQDAEALATGKSRFLANMSHELRTPLNAIMGFSDIMKARLFGPMPEKYGEYGQLIHEAGSHLLDLINDVLDMSKIEADRFELSRELFDAREAVSAALRLVRLQADAAGVQLRGLLPARALEVDADRRAIKQIVLNLVSNALKFTPRGGSVTVTLQGVGRTMELIVADTGVGISQEDLDRLGKPFEQAGDSDQRAMGTGLGLSLVRSFAELHGGDMVLESVLGEGASVTVRLPVVLEPAAPGPAAPTDADNVVAFTPPM